MQSISIERKGVKEVSIHVISGICIHVVKTHYCKTITKKSKGDKSIGWMANVV